MDTQKDLSATDRCDRDIFSISELFHENTKLRRTPDGLVLGGKAPPSTPEVHYALRHPWKRYASTARTRLPRPLDPLRTPIELVIRSRQSVREFSGTAISFEQLSYVLDLSYGTLGETLLDDGVAKRQRRVVPSAGALYPIELYPIVFQADGLQGGVYHYQPEENSLECLQLGDLHSTVNEMFSYPEVVAQASAVLLLVAIFQRNRFKYGERGYRFILLDAGHIAQNMYLVATALGLGAVAIGGFLDDKLNEFLGLDGVDEAVVYSVAIGCPLV
ncbi:MAG TPA: SagB/ThcOx family dehydrogenase [Paraburkholderia sp.]|uniref:SagB/ThcOx family dehydrogenase n=1 Tax=Paraburkholderia sp. TaxID=1926495 RepID=UPI002B4837D9|nr:SagB/ThcOx family dehydrogenase [Paraburkholderia sp.]HKR41083.1 SagB/ThcOx family dehydrogenase [Paraburkholderia sp.]